MATNGLVEFLLSLEFMLGMYLNLFGNQSNLMLRIILIAHISDGIVMFVAMVISLYISIAERFGLKSVLLDLSTLLSIVIAGLMGAIFINYGHSGLASYMMALFFLLAFGFIGYESLVARRFGEKNFSDIREKKR